jgi:protein tyrosine/serine phosphatase
VHLGYDDEFYTQDYTHMRLLPRNRALRLGICLVACLGLYFLWDFVIQRNLHTVVDGKLYRSGQPRREQLEHWIKHYHLRTIVVLKPTLKPYEKEIAEKYKVALHHIPLSTRHGPSDHEWQRIRALLTDDRNMPLLYHCLDGADKTGLVTAMYRVEIQRWPLWKALLEMDLHYHIPWSRPALQEFLKSRYNEPPLPAEARGER